MDVDTHPEGGFFLSQTSDILKCVVKHGLSDAKPVATPGDPDFHFDDGIASEGINITDYRLAIGDLLYFAICTRPDIMATVIICAQFQRTPSAKAWLAVKRIIQYLKGTPNVGIRLAPTSLDITAYSDASHGNSSVG